MPHSAAECAPTQTEWGLLLRCLYRRDGVSNPQLGIETEELYSQMQQHRDEQPDPTSRSYQPSTRECVRLRQPTYEPDRLSP
eukprot:m.199463 g.199463  ORF g.199463 m.199463 type:complete len:82 (-) comp18778_c0_seq20:2527-2772(-)